jgi:hypothetical protein
VADDSYREYAVGEEPPATHREVGFFVSHPRAEEIAELTDCVPWRWWAKYQTFARQNARVEIVDLLRFLISLAQGLEMRADAIFEAYTKKHEVNLNRRDSGYPAKDENDNKPI